MAVGVRVRLFDDGKFIGMRQFSTIEALHARGLVRVSYSKRGSLVRPDCVHLEQLKAEPPDQRLLSAAALPLTTRYSYRDREIVARPWDLRRLNGSRIGTNYAKGALPADFIGVVRSCLRHRYRLGRQTCFS